MNIAELFIRRPVMTTLVMLAILLFGILGYRTLAVSDLPNVDYPTIQVSASLPGASPDTMASAIATPLEKQFSTIAGIDSMTSTSSLGTSAITLQFSLSRNIDAAAHAHAADVHQSQPRGPADSLRRDGLENFAVVHRRPVRRDADGPAHLDGYRGRAGAGIWFAKVCRPRATRPAVPGHTTDRYRRS